MIRNVLWPVKNIKNQKGYIESLAQSTQYFKETFIGLPENLVGYARNSSSQIFLCQINQSLTPKIFV